MAEIHGKTTKVYVGGFDLTSLLQKVSFSASADVPDATTFGLNSKRYLAGITDGKVKAEGLWSYDETQLTLDKADEILSAALNGAGQAWVECIGGDLFGNRGRAAIGIEHSYDIEADVGDLVKVTAEAQASGFSVEPVVIYQPRGQVAAGGNTASTDFGAVGVPTTNGLSAYLLVGDVSNGGVLTVKVQQSTDNITFTDLLTFTVVNGTAAVDRSSERKEVAGNVNRYLRVLWTLAGAAPTATFFAAVNRK